MRRAIAQIITFIVIAFVIRTNLRLIQRCRAVTSVQNILRICVSVLVWLLVNNIYDDDKESQKCPIYIFRDQRSINGDGLESKYLSHSVLHEYTTTNTAL